MSRPWMPLYPADYLADTEHLTAAESGAYLLLLMHYWQRGGLPDDDARLTRIARMTEAEWRAARPMISAFFEHPGWKHGRVEEELAKAASISNKRRAAAGQRYDREEQNEDANADANDGTNAVQLHTPLQPQPPLPSNSDSQAHTPRAREDFEEFWEAYPKRDGANPKQPALKQFQEAVKSGVPPGSIVTAVRRYAEELRRKGDHGSRFVAKAVTWLAEQRWGDYPESQVVVAGAAVSVFIDEETEQWLAWQTYLKATTGRGSPKHKFGWYFPTEWPPDHERKAA